MKIKSYGTTTQNSMDLSVGQTLLLKTADLYLALH